MGGLKHLEGPMGGSSTPPSNQAKHAAKRLISDYETYYDRFEIDRKGKTEKISLEVLWFFYITKLKRKINK